MSGTPGRDLISRGRPSRKDARDVKDAMISIGDIDRYVPVDACNTYH